MIYQKRVSKTSLRPVCKILEPNLAPIIACKDHAGQVWRKIRLSNHQELKIWDFFEISWDQMNIFLIKFFQHK